MPLLNCKLYRASKRKSNILGAISDPINSELVKQLRSYLDDEYLTSDYLDPSETSVDDTAKSEPSSKTDDDNGSRSPAHSQPPQPHVAKPDSHISDDANNLPHPDASSDEDDKDDTDSDTGESTSSNLQSASQVSSEPVLSSAQISEIDISDYAQEVINTLNLRDDTCGVTRSLFKGNEFWIYYNDKINLNSVMSVVLDVLASAGYTHLEFNRLARTDNAIVFDVVDIGPTPAT